MPADLHFLLFGASLETSSNPQLTTLPKTPRQGTKLIVSLSSCVARSELVRHYFVRPALPDQMYELEAGHLSSE